LDHLDETATIFTSLAGLEDCLLPRTAGSSLLPIFRDTIKNMANLRILVKLYSICKLASILSKIKLPVAQKLFSCRISKTKTK